MASDEVKAVTPRGQRWWKIGFFVLLFVFELTREVAVMWANQTPQMSVNKLVKQYGQFVMAQGRWIRSDGGGRLIPLMAVISCDRETGKCEETTVTTNDNYVNTPDTSRYEATFTPDLVTYVNDDPDCVRYTTRLDLKMETASQVRERKPSTNPNCAIKEKRMEMRLDDGFQREDSKLALEGHFLPIIKTLTALFGN